MSQHFVDDPTKSPYVLPMDSTLPEITSLILIICTNGVFQQETVVEALVEAQEGDAAQVPVISEESFVFPPKANADGDGLEQLRTTKYGASRRPLRSGKIVLGEADVE